MTLPARLRSLPAVIAGLIAGFLGAVAAGAMRDARQRSAPIPSQSQSGLHHALSVGSVPSIMDSEARGRIADLTSRLDSLERSTHDASIGIQRRQTHAPTEHPRASAEQAIQEYDQFDALVAEHLGHPVSPAWASSATQRLNRDLVVIAERARFRLADVLCRTDSCVVRIEWQNYRDAAANFRTVMLGDYQMRCARSVSLRPPVDAALPYQAQFIFDCSESE